MSWLRENRTYVIGVMVCVIIILLVLHDVSNMSVSGHREKTINYMSSETFQYWLDEMESIRSILEPAETNLDVKEALNYTSAARQFANILDWTIEVHPRPPDFAEHLYLRMASATIMLDKALSRLVTELPATMQNLDDDTLQKIRNIAATVENLLNTVGTAFTRAHYDAGPIQQLEDNGVLDQAKNYVEQIEMTSIEIWEKYSPYF